MSILINKAIYYILSGTTGITQTVGTKMYPIAADDDAKNPFIVYERKSINTFYSKDGLAYDECLVDVICVSDTYGECIELAEKVRQALELKTGTFSGVKIMSSVLENSTETYGVDNYIQILTFKIKTIK
jgi:hypothetical protein